MVCLKRLALMTGITVLIVLIVFLAKESWAAEKKALKVEHVTIGAGQVRNMNVLPIELGIKEGIYKKEGLEIELLLMKGFVAMASLKNDDLEFAISGGTAIRSSVAGMPIKMFMVMRDRSGMSMVGRPGINSVRDLKGKVIGVGTIGDTMDFAAREVLAYSGLDPDKDVIMRQVGVGAITFMALKNGTVDGAVMNVFHVIKLTHGEKKGFKELMAVDEAMKGVSNGMIASIKRIKENPEQVKRIIKGTLRSVAYVRENRKEAIEFMIKELGVEKELASILYEREREGYNQDGMVSDENFQLEIKRAQKRGLIPTKEVSTSQLRDFTLLEEVLKEVGIR